jgi:hypothetical protein
MAPGRFNPEKVREFLVGIYGYERFRKRDLADIQSRAALGAVADSSVTESIECLLVGFDEPARHLLEKALEWVPIAIAANERPQRYFPNGTEASRFETLTLCKWLLFDEHDAESYSCYAEFEDRYLSDRFVGRAKTEVSFVLPQYVDAGLFERVLEIFQANPGLSPPTSLTIQGEARMSYVVSRYRLGLQYTAAEFNVMTTKFLNRNVDAWLGEGHWSRAARWMKIIHWNDAEPPISAKEALLKCYDYLPGRQPPGMVSTPP